jgi:hypothetical protein
VRDDVPSVVADSEEERRAARVQPVKAEEVEARHLRDTAALHGLPDSSNSGSSIQPNAGR